MIACIRLVWGEGGGGRECVKVWDSCIYPISIMFTRHVHTVMSCITLFVSNPACKHSVNSSTIL